jgi:cellulose synthase/poly-beta-1,6-N-acetylglucosamine synthase-like glycosyltransferase
MTLPLFCLILIFLFLAVQALLFFMVAAKKSEPILNINDNDWPTISILVAARNEESNIAACLLALTELDYPKHKVQILVGDDQSEDQTKALIQKAAQANRSICLVDITTDLGKAKGKANVLAQLAHKATGEFYLITDADIVVNTQWAKDLVAHFTNPQLAIVSAITLVHGPSLLARLQGVDWLFFMGLLKGADNAGIRCTAVGNNMAIRKEAYEDVGGYESLDFSVTEDFKLYKEVRKKNWKTLNILSRNSLNISKPVDSFIQLMHQRKRWLMGARELPFYWWLLFGLLASFFPAVLVLAFYQPFWALQLYFIKIGLQGLFIAYLRQKLFLRQHFLTILLYDPYATVVAMGTQLFYVLPITMQWKKRKYS